MAYYIGGFTWEGKSQLSRFRDEGIWENGYGEEKYQELFNKIHPGDYFALKSTFVQDQKSWLKIVNVGIVKEILSSSALKVEWLEEIEKRLTDIRWYANTLEKIENRRDIARIFGQAIKMKKMGQFIDVLQSKKQIILQGAPGTGKTYVAKDIAEQLIFGEVSEDKKLQAERLQSNKQFKLIQFHPSYTYEDFVRGIEVKTKNGQPEYITRNKVLGEFASLAQKNRRDSQKKTDELSKEGNFEKKLDQFKEYVREVIAEKSEYPIGKTKAKIIDISYDSFKYNYQGKKPVYNLLFSDLIKMHNDGQKFENVKAVNDCNVKMKGKGSFYLPLFNEINLQKEEELSQEGITEKKYVLIIDEINRANLPVVLGELIYALEYRDEKVESIYSVDGSDGLVLPSNLYIIGTMNTADRSVGQIDYAIRRRFAFIDMLPKVLTDTPDFDSELFRKVSAFFIENVDEYIADPENILLKRSSWLSEEFSPEDVWLGHSYFIMKDHNRKIRLNYEIKPILEEYIKDGILKENVNGQMIKELIGNL